jgi:hypothetical protein
MGPRNLESSNRNDRLKLSAFSTACCEWKLTTSSACSGSRASDSAAARSDAALCRKRSATSISSGVGKDATLAEGPFDERPANSGPASGELAIHDDDVDRCQYVVELSSQTHGFARRVLHVGLDYENIEVGSVVCRPPRPGAEQNHPRAGRHGAPDTGSNRLDDLGRSHRGDGTS